MVAMRRNILVWVLGAACLLTVISASSAQRVDAGSALPDNSGNGVPSLDEIIVSARKRDERVIDIPESITVISGSDLVAKSITTVDDLARQTPNLQLNMRQDLTTNVVIRGVGAYGDVLGVGFNIDNVPNFTDQTMRLEDLESVEILKGPQGTLYGGSSIGGVVRYVSKKPSFDWSGEVMSAAGSYNQVNIFAAQNLVLSAGRLAMRISGYDAKTDGYITNNALAIEGNPSTDYGVRAMLLYTPTDDVSALLTLRHSYIRNGADEYIPRPSVTSFTFEAPFFQPTFNKRTTNGAVLELNANIGSQNKLTSITSYTYAQYAQSIDTTFTPPGVPGLSLFTLPGNRPTEVATQEVRLTSASGHAYDWLIGIYGASIRNVLLNQNGISNYPPPPLPMVVNDFNTTRIDLATFGTFNYHLGNITVGAGLRIGETRYKANILVEAGGPPDQSASVTSHATLPKVSLSYTMPSGQLLYANISKGEEPGAVNTVSTAPIPFKSETATSFEAGTKGEAFVRRLEYEVAAFYVSNRALQAQTNNFIPPIGLVTLVSNVGDARTYGVEAILNWRIARDFTLNLSGGYLNAKWISGAIFGASVGGNTVPNSPPVTANIGMAYSRPMFAGLRINANFDMSYTDKFWWDLVNTPGTAEPAYWLGNARMALGADDRTWQVALGVTNIFNAHFWTEYNPNFYAPGQPLPCIGCTDLGAAGAPRQIVASVLFRR